MQVTSGHHNLRSVQITVGRSQSPPAVIAIDSRDGSVQEDVDTVLVGVSFEVVHHVIAGREQWRAMRESPTGQMGELTAGVEFESVVSRAPRGPDAIGAID
jgi:hypothetical protein